MLKTNIVESNEFHKAQKRTLDQLRNALLCSFGPMGSNTMIVKENQYNRYTKDGKTILENCQFQNVIETFCAKDICEITRNIVLTVGDGTTSAIILSSLIFNTLYENEAVDKYPPVTIAEAIRTVADKMTEIIRAKATIPTPEDIYNIALISTNGNTDLANELKVVYEKYGNEVFIDVSINNGKETLVKEYNGMTLNNGFADPCFVNTGRSVSLINDAYIYAFKDPVDTPEMLNFMLKILNTNIIGPLRLISEGKPAKCTPTVILTPRFGVDTDAYVEDIISSLSQYPVNARPPLLIVKNISDWERYEDIVNLCGARFISKPISDKAREQQIKDGLAPTIDNVVTWAAGRAESVEANTIATKFVNPKRFYEEKEDGTLDVNKPSVYYQNYMAVLTQKLDQLQHDGNANAHEIGSLKRRINSLKANMVEIQVGGISPTDRDADRDLIEDAVLNCRSAAAKGFGRAANIEGLLAIKELKDNLNESDEGQYKLVVNVIYEAYTEIVRTLLSTTKVLHEDAIDAILNTIIEEGTPFNVKTRAFDNYVISSIESDVAVMQSIAKILSISITANQCLTPNVLLNTYSKEVLE